MTSPAHNETKLSRDDLAIPATDTTVYQALFQRRMAWAFKDEPVSRAAVERMLSTAVWAPNHRKTEPWRFYVLEQGGPVHQQVGDLAYEHDLEQTFCWHRRRPISIDPL